VRDMALLKSRFEFGDYLPVRCPTGATLVGGRLVRINAALGGYDGLHGKPTVEHTFARTHIPYGVNEYDVLGGEEGSVNRNHTILLLEANGAIAAGDLVVPSVAANAAAADAGRVVTMGAGAVNEVIIGQALHAVGSAGEKVWVAIPFGFLRHSGT
jgi:hypothetical protein